MGKGGQMMRGTVGLFIFVCLVTTGLKASTESRALLQDGITDIQSEHYAEALAKFQSAQQVDPKDSDALFFQGMALNRLGKYQDALTAFRAAQKAGNRNRDLAFEGAWSEMHTGHFAKAIVLLKRYEEIYPGRGQTSEFMGRAYGALGKYDLARKEMAEAVRRDPRLHPTVDLYLAEMGVVQSGTAEARANLLATVRREKDTPLGRAVAPLTFVPAQSAKPWNVLLSAGAGYNSNIANVGQGISTPTGVAYKGAAFGEFAVDGNYRWDLTPEDQVKIGYDLQSDIYEGASAVDYNDHFWHADYAHQWHNQYAVSARVSDEYATYGGDSFRNQVGGRVAGGVKLATWNTMEAAYAYGWGSYYLPLPAADDRSGSVHTLSLSDYVLVPGTKAQLGLTYYHLFNEALGSDFKYNGDGLVVTAASPLFWEISGALSYNLEFDDYRHPNTFSTSGYRRSDEVNSITVQFTRPITGWLKAYARYSFTDDHSNVSFFKYDQNIVSGGMIVQF